MKSENESVNFTEVYKGDSSNISRNIVTPPNERNQSRKQPEISTTSLYSNCLIDHSRRQFVCFHDQCLKHKNCFKKKSPDDISDFQALYFHPEDKALLCEKIFPDILKFMEEVPANERSDYSLSFNHRYIHKDGTTSQFLQEGTLVISDNGNLPVLNLRVFTEIGDFKTDETMILSIFRFNAQQGYQKVWTREYSNNDTSQLSPREIEIIRLCLEGLSSKMIADRLNLSIHTVKNHKRNCMEKTFTHNITELIHLCIQSHWI